MKALKIEPGKAPERIDIGNELEALQDAVGGYIQVLYPDQHRPVGLICNEEDAAYFEKLFHSPEKFKYFAGRLVISKVVSGGA